MRIKKVNLVNFRNYTTAHIEIPPGRSFILGDNAQGKSNFLEAIEVACLGKSDRTSQDNDLIRWGEKELFLKVTFERAGRDWSVSYCLNQTPSADIVKQIQVNEVSQKSTRAMLGKLVSVTFAGSDLNLLRGGPRYRRQWLDNILYRLNPNYQLLLNRYTRVVTQRNRLLKNLFEKGKVNASDQDLLKAWDKQLAQLGSLIIMRRSKLLVEMLPLAQHFQEKVSGQHECLSVQYCFRAPETAFDESTTTESDQDSPLIRLMTLEELVAASEQEIANTLLDYLKKSRFEEISRRQSLFGPHRDDVLFFLNNTSATSFASQGQQRSLVLSLKLAELEKIKEQLQEPPVLLLDDVMAELDPGRQRFLMSCLDPDAQSIITTTHLSGFEPEWLAGSTIFSVTAGQICSRSLCMTDDKISTLTGY